MTAGTRPGGNIANGNSVMFDTGKILNCGGSEAFAMEEYPATNAATLITITAANVQPQVKTLAPMKLKRVYGNGVVLPDGKVLITGGASHPKEFSDIYAHKQPGVLFSCCKWCDVPVTEYFPVKQYINISGAAPSS